MKIIKIYDKDFTELTTLTEADFNNLQYSRILEGVGDFQFLVRLDRPKVTTDNLKKFNRVEVIEDGVVQFIGVLTKLDVGLDTALVRGRELTFILKRRLVGSSYVVNTTISLAVANLLTTLNGVEDTGISAGEIAAAGSVNSTFNFADALTVLKQITSVTGNQFVLNNDRTLTVKPDVGTDKTDSVIFQYNINLVAASNILNFKVEDDGEPIVSKAYGKSGGFNSSQEDASLKSEYGLHEKYRDFRVANSSTVLDDFTEAEISDRVFSPEIELNPDTPDNFDIGDTVRVVLQNSLINIDESYQVLEKRVEYIGNQKRLKVRINDLPNDLAERLSERDARIALLEQKT